MAVFKIKLAFASTVLLGMELLQVLLPRFSMLMTFCRMSKAKGRLHQMLGNSVDSRTELLKSLPFGPFSHAILFKRDCPLLLRLANIISLSETLFPNTQEVELPSKFKIIKSKPEKDSDIMKKA